MPDTGPLYAVRDIPGKGKGLIATSKIPKGARIISEPPLFKVSRENLTADETNAELAKLSNAQRSAFYSLQNSWPGLGPEVGIVRTNAKSCGLGAKKGGIFLEAARINHSCAPNAMPQWREDVQRLTIHAIKDIEVGEEIASFYLGTRTPYVTRQQQLKTFFHIDQCTCSLCSLPEDERKIKDAIFDEYQRLDNSWNNGDSITLNPLKSFHTVRRLLHLIKIEGTDDRPIPQLCMNAFQFVVAHQDFARAKIFAKRAVKGRIILEGVDSPEIKDLLRWVKDPSKYRSDYISAKWKTSVKDIPKNLGETDFENWLWRHEEPVGTQFANLRNDAYFPRFNELPWEDELGLDYYRGVGDGIFEPRKHWAALGEITSIDWLFRVRLVVKDRAGDEFPVAFYTDTQGREMNPSALQVGNTVVVLYGTQHHFLDGTIGIRHEEPNVLKIFPVSLDNLMLLNDKLKTHATITDEMRTCHGCNKKSANLMKCSKCGVFWYCSKDCQTRVGTRTATRRIRFNQSQQRKSRLDSIRPRRRPRHTRKMNLESLRRDFFSSDFHAKGLEDCVGEVFGGPLHNPPQIKQPLQYSQQQPPRIIIPIRPMLPRPAPRRKLNRLAIQARLHNPRLTTRLPFSPDDVSDGENICFGEVDETDAVGHVEGYASELGFEDWG
ncbi:SET domain protein [Fusarium austroafricanum]|uniref:SET domain protein n=1 Tax=Fusarium austroafricanum TaxID=2364996 RepID=A0A8H4JX01_9HYPO|nr:SET domain protein [Fusarium austroafricanum]